MSGGLAEPRQPGLQRVGDQILLGRPARFGMGLVFVTAMPTPVSGVAQLESGAASRLLKATQMVRGSLGVLILVTVFGTAIRNEVECQLASFLSESTPPSKRPPPKPTS
ncbi:hypothetical protein ACIQ7Q_27035 [Streptomyces sp. NPDC096176]|uniref:hypothetical protein n=1 Tax=Streptomyces sp. NPDC096176 TaxID=3366079 RepID=UPI00382BF38E